VPDPRAPPPPASTGTGAGKRQEIERAHGVRILGKDADNDTYLRNIEFALSRYPAGSMRGLEINIDVQDLRTTGGIGGFWTVRGGQPTLTVYQADDRYVHIAVHELAHHHDLFVNRGRPTPDLIDAAQVNGQVPPENVPSPYGRYGLNTPSKRPEYGAEVISWSLDMNGSPGFQAFPTWRPQRRLVERLEKYLDRDKIVWNRGN
jgi:hypothetical protein